MKIATLALLLALAACGEDAAADPPKLGVGPCWRLTGGDLGVSEEFFPPDSEITRDEHRITVTRRGVKIGEFAGQWAAVRRE